MSSNSRVVGSFEKIANIELQMPYYRLATIAYMYPFGIQMTQHEL